MRYVPVPTRREQKKEEEKEKEGKRLGWRKEKEYSPHKVENSRDDLTIPFPKQRDEAIAVVRHTRHTRLPAN
jgi:hypothetical protein